MSDTVFYIVFYECPLLVTSLYLVRKVSAAVLMSVLPVSAVARMFCVFYTCLLKSVRRMSAATAPMFSLLYQCVLQ